VFDQNGLSLDQAPPITVVFRFFIFGALFGIGSGLFLAWQGPAALEPAETAGRIMTHLLTLGVDYQDDRVSSTTAYAVTSRDNTGVFAQYQGEFGAHDVQLSLRQDVNRTDLSAFARAGGKLLIAHGTADQLVSSRASAEYYRRIRRDMGPGKTRQFLRYYEIPGYGHAASTQFNAAWDSLSALEAWVEHGRAPRRQTVTDTVGVPGRTRPLCEYPSWPRYVGKGDVNRAESFVCSPARGAHR